MTSSSLPLSAWKIRSTFDGVVANLPIVIIIIGMMLVGGGEGLPAAGQQTFKFEEYLIEHEVSGVQARNAALTIDPDSLFTPLGCQTCSRDEMRYCESSNFVHDHCCCDRRLHEQLPYIPHTCYFGRKLCKPIAGHCDEYTKIRLCCCDKHALKLWKDKSSADSITVTSTEQAILCASLLLSVVLFNRAIYKT